MTNREYLNTLSDEELQMLSWKKYQSLRKITSIPDLRFLTLHAARELTLKSGSERSIWNKGMSVVQLYKGDCLEIMKDIPDKSVDMILCDLPYGATKNKADKRLPFTPLWKQYKRIIKDNGYIALFAQGKFYIDLANSNLE